MEVKELEIAIHEWRRETNGEKPSVIAISHETFNELASDEEATKHIELYEVDGRIIGHKFNGIPLAITDEVQTYEIYSKEEHKEKVKE